MIDTRIATVAPPSAVNLRITSIPNHAKIWTSELLAACSAIWYNNCFALAVIYFLITETVSMFEIFSLRVQETDAFVWEWLRPAVSKALYFAVPLYAAHAPFIYRPVCARRVDIYAGFFSVNLQKKYLQFV